MVGNNNPFTTENTRKQGKTTVGEEMMGGWQVTPAVGFLVCLTEDVTLTMKLVTYKCIFLIIKLIDIFPQT